MNRIKIKFEKVYDIDNVKKAIVNASKNKKNRDIVRKCLNNSDKVALKISEMIKNRTYKLSSGSLKVIDDGSRKKKRTICRPKFYPDQIIHWAVMQVIEPEMLKRFYSHSYASIPNKGTHMAKRNLAGALKKDMKGTKYCLEFDIHHAYDSVNKTLMVEFLSRKFKDKQLVQLLEDIICSYTYDGLPKGFYPSAWLFNFYLTQVDNFIKQDLKVKYYFRYMDNFQIYHSNKRTLHKIKERCFEFIQTKLGLEIKSNWQIYPMPYKGKKGNRFTDFVGFKFYRFKTTIRKTIFLRIKRLIAKIQNHKYTKRLASKFFSYWGYIKSTCSYMFRQKYIYGKINLKKLKEKTI